MVGDLFDREVELIKLLDREEVFISCCVERFFVEMRKYNYRYGVIELGSNFGKFLYILN